MMSPTTPYTRKWCGTCLCKGFINLNKILGIFIIALSNNIYHVYSKNLIICIATFIIAGWQIWHCPSPAVPAVPRVQVDSGGQGGAQAGGVPARPHSGRGVQSGREWRLLDAFNNHLSLLQLVAVTGGGRIFQRRQASLGRELLEVPDIFDLFCIYLIP